MIWPDTLAAAALIRSLHSQRSVELPEEEEDQREQQQQHQQREQDQAQQTTARRRMSRMRYFWWICLCAFLYNFLPFYIFPSLGMLSILCWIAPKNLVLSQLTGGQGLGIGTITLDWTMIQSSFPPLLTPWWVQANVFAGMILFQYLTAASGYFTDVLGAKSYPITSTSLFSADETRYIFSRVMNRENWTLNEQAYKEYGIIRLPISTIMMNFFSFAVLSASVSHAIMHHGSDMRRLYKTGYFAREDVHTRMMRAYPEVPDLWYKILMGVMVLTTLITCQVYDSMPWWATLLVFVVVLVLILPLGIILAMKNQKPPTTVFGSLIAGYILPGHLKATYMFMNDAICLPNQTLTYLTGLKLGHYLKVPPRIMFWTQLIGGGLLGGVVNLATYRVMFAVSSDICSSSDYFCPSINALQLKSTFTWGVFGPKRIFSRGLYDGGYWFIQVGLLVGASLPVLTWYLNKKILPTRYGSYLDLVHWPIILSPGIMMVTTFPYAVANSVFVGFIFMFVLRRYRFEW
ncbi:hypothetical protein BGZ83_005074 [Gryganskiella cystojenkinii]|nr:hypothetical protein BGZ83_005074 [Gryganskiella cystojenkinii]